MHSQVHPFKHIEHQRYRVTFLATVKLTLVYDWDKDRFDAFKDFFRKFFGMEINQSQFDLKNADSIRLKNDDSGSKIKFSRNVAEIIVEGDKYVDFLTSISPFLNAFQEYLKNIGSDVVNISLEKINIWPLDEVDKNTDDKLMSVIFSNDLLAQQSTPQGNLQTCDFIKTDQGYSFIIRYGVTNEFKRKVVILDTICNLSSKLTPHKLQENLMDMNQLMFDAYHWAVKEEVIQAMR